MWRYSCVAVLLPILLMLQLQWDGGVDAAPTLGLLSLLASNGTDLLSTLLINHIQEKVNTLEIIADFISAATNSTG